MVVGGNGTQKFAQSGTRLGGNGGIVLPTSAIGDSGDKILAESQ